MDNLSLDYSRILLNNLIKMNRSQRKEIKKEIFEKLARIAQTLGCASRLKIIHILSQSTRTVEELATLSDETIANTSQHLQRLAKEGIVQATRDGLNKHYRLKNEKVIWVWETLQDLAHEIAPELNSQKEILIEKNLQSKESSQEVLMKSKDQQAILLDVRSEFESQSTPVEGAKNIPLDQLKEKLKTLNQNKPIYVFCRGKYCTTAADAVKTLREAGFDAFRLEESSFRLKQLNKK